MERITVIFQYSVWADSAEGMDMHRVRCNGKMLLEGRNKFVLLCMHECSNYTLTVKLRFPANWYYASCGHEEFRDEGETIELHMEAIYCQHAAPDVS